MIENITFSYGVAKLNAYEYWRRGITGNNVKVGIFDGGISPHLALKPNVSGFGVNENDTILDYNVDSTGHGTHVAGILAGSHNYPGIYAGIAPDVQLYSIKILTVPTMRSFLIGLIKGIEWAIDANLDILNMSIDISESLISRYEEYRQPLIDAFTNLDNEGILVCVAAGNQNKGEEDNLTTNGFLQKMPGVTVVSSLNRYDQSSIFTGRGPQVNLAGYGNDIIAPFRDNTVPVSKKMNLLSGTSMATPQITGIAALYKEIYPNYNKQELLEAIYQNAKKIEGVANYEQGFGVPQPPNDLYRFEILKEYNQQFLRKLYGWESLNVYLEGSPGYEKYSIGSHR
ncbi:hypothetical protein J6TS1_01290 [Siminovitchia terrae]|uniref:Peptidase S8/S53 domain-containing protein n=1 Tax=Siminovitchia terrae TaxID=1914933 RepID=A0ABQ4KRJ5_SIMTE|nr:S8 family serine peptidase [Siminovitchia terrae]GIN94259.1 hypothetical protein J6TS1_01290 [Siminovitchia terrae]